MLLVDDREGSSGLIGHFPPESCKLIRLDGGDVAFFGCGPDGALTYPIGIEYKTAKEALQCMLDGRLAGEQLPKMSRLYKRVYLLIEGEYREGPDGLLQFPAWKSGKKTWVSYSKVLYRAFDNWMNSLTETARIVIKRSLDRPESAAQILNLYNLWAKPYANHLSVFQFNKSQEPALLIKPSLTRRIAACLPGLGWELSGRAADYFGNVVNLVNAGVEEWTKIHGVGKSKAEKVWKSLRE